MAQERITDRIRSDFAFVAHCAQHVKINQQRLNHVFEVFPRKPLESAFDSEHHMHALNPELAAGYIFALDSINFGAPFKMHLMRENVIHRESGSLYRQVAKALKRWYEADPPSARTLALLSPQKLRRILGFGNEGPASRKLTELFTCCLNETGRFVQQETGGWYLPIVQQAEGSVDSFIEMIIAIPHFQDCADYKGRKITFGKRAQILAADMQMAFGKAGIEAFHDTERLTVFVDDVVPRVFYETGVTEYSSDLSLVAAQSFFLPETPDMETEMRACAGHIGGQIAQQTHLQDMNVDHHLWGIGSRKVFFLDDPQAKKLWDALYVHPVNWEKYPAAALTNY